MKIIKKILCFLMFASSSSFANPYSLEPLTDDAAKYVAPPEIQRAMRVFVGQDLDDCVKEKKLNSDQKASYFGSTKIEIGPRASEYVLVFPSEYCSAFYGAHAIAYWLLGKQKNGNFALLYSGRSDGFEILENMTNGLHDLRSVYGRTFIILKYDGTNYKKVGDGEFLEEEDVPN